MIKYRVRFWRYNLMNDDPHTYKDEGLFDRESDAYDNIQKIRDSVHGINYRTDTSCDWDEVVFETPDNLFRYRFTVSQEDINPYNIDKNVHYFMEAMRKGPCLPFSSLCLCDPNDTDWTECEIVEDRYSVDEGYKVTLRPIDTNFAREDFYQYDFISMMHSGHIVKKSPTTHIEHVRFAEPIGCGLYIITEANLVSDM